MNIRYYQPQDIEQVAALFYSTVHEINVKDYTKEQLDAWATGEIDQHAWNSSFLAHTSLVVVQGDQILGFADMDATGYLDRLYVHKDYQRRRIATSLCDALELHSQKKCFTTHASITAKPFFEQRGYVVIKEQQVEKDGVLLMNFIMQKRKEVGYGTE